MNKQTDIQNKLLDVDELVFNWGFPIHNSIHSSLEGCHMTQGPTHLLMFLFWPP